MRAEVILSELWTLHTISLLQNLFINSRRNRQGKAKDEHSNYYQKHGLVHIGKFSFDTPIDFIIEKQSEMIRNIPIQSKKAKQFPLRSRHLQIESNLSRQQNRHIAIIGIDNWFPIDIRLSITQTMLCINADNDIIRKEKKIGLHCLADMLFAYSEMRRVNIPSLQISEYVQQHNHHFQNIWKETRLIAYHHRRHPKCHQPNPMK